MRSSISLPARPLPPLVRSFQIALLLLMALGFVSKSHAVFIDFNDMVVNYPEDARPGNGPEGTDRYASQGLLVTAGEFWGVEAPDGSTQIAIIGVQTVGFRFIGDQLPVSVSMDASSHYEDDVIFEVFGKDGVLLDSVSMLGWAADMEAGNPAAPYEPQVVNLNYSEGIERIWISAFYGMRYGAWIDNLNFEYASASVPAPATFGLMLIGLLGLGWMRCRRT